MHQENLVAHRGYPLHYPENTIAGIEAALAAGAKYVEVDIQLTRDGVPVLFHDHDLQRLCQQPGAVHDYQWQQLQQFVVHGSSELPLKLNTVPIASLQDLVIVIKASPGARFFIELKRTSVEQFGAKQMVETVLAGLQPVDEQCIVISYSLEALQQVRRQSKLPIGVVIDEWQQHTRSSIADLQPEFLFFDIDSIPPGESLHYPGAGLVVFETTDPQQARMALQQGVDLVETFAIGEMHQQMAPDD
jgi:glycerophosphoryl diester phosphodiesterase